MVVTKQFQTDVEEILKNAFSRPDFVANLCKTLASTICEKIEKDIIEVKNELSETKVKYEELKVKIGDIERKYEQKVDNIEQSTRKKNLRIFGLVESQTENTVEIVRQFLQTQLGVLVLDSDIDRCHRVGKPSQNKSRSIFLRLTSYQKKNEIYSNKKKLKGQGQTIREDLTKIRLQRYQDAVAKYGLKNVWTKDNQIFVNKGNKIEVFSGDINK